MNTPSPIVYVVDDDDGVRSGLARLIRSMGLAVQTFGSAMELLAHDVADEPACLILDVGMPGLDGMQLSEELQRRGRRIPIVFLTGQGSIPMSVRAMKSGAVEFLTKPVSDETLERAIEEALARGRAQRLVQDELVRIDTLLARLTPREREVMDRVALGQLNKQIAADLGTVEQTVKIHRGRVMKKLEINSVAELVRLAERRSALAAELGLAPGS